MTTEASPFAALGLRQPIVDALTALGYEAPTPIQERTIPLVLSGRDVIGQAQTGTGKTAAFALPILEKIDPRVKHTQALVLTPTRELAMQVAEAIHSYSQKLDHVSVLPVYGGAPIVPQLKRLERGAHVVVGTPGRLIDHLDRKSLDLSHVKLLVLDEADEMLKMGFAEDVEKILASAPAERQIALFSATMPDEVMRIARRHLREPERVEIEHKTMTAPAIEQRFLTLAEGQKLEVLTSILELEESEGVLIFRRTKTGSAELAEKLEARGFAAVAMHGDMSQPLREGVIRRLRSGQVDIVVATDVAARGLDVEQITHVVNYDIPYDVEAYVHRIGRTGRAGRTGVATLFVTPRERRMMREIERFTGHPIKPMKMPTRADIAAKRVAVFKDNIRKTIAEGELDLYLELVEQLVEEGQHDIAEIAAAAVRIASGARTLRTPKEEEAPAPAPYESAPRHEARGEARPDTGRTVRLSMDVGKRDGIRPADIVGSIANEADVPGREIGPIEIREDITFVGIPERYVDVVIAKVGKKKFRGTPLNVKVARATAPVPEDRRRREAPRDERPRRESFRDDRPRRESFRDDRPRTERPAPRGKSFSDDRPRADRPAPRGKSFGEDRPRTERPAPRGKSFGAAKKFESRAPRREDRPKRDDRPDRPTAFDRFGVKKRPKR